MARTNCWHVHGEVPSIETCYLVPELQSCSFSLIAIVHSSGIEVELS